MRAKNARKAIEEVIAEGIKWGPYQWVSIYRVADLTGRGYTVTRNALNQLVREGRLSRHTFGGSYCYQRVLAPPALPTGMAQVAG